jgi:glycerophosphoryl diester phosphodiesterase
MLHGADGFEFDIRSTSNQHPFVCHDPRFNRLPVRRHTLRQLQASCDSRGEEFPPCLEDVLRRYARSAFLNIEVKVKGAERVIYRWFNHASPQRGYFISSFLPGVVREFHHIDENLVLGTLSQSRWQLRRWEKLPVTYVVPHYRLLSRRLVEEIHSAKRLVITWTVNDQKRMLRAAELGVDGIISDDTKLLVQTLRGERFKI